ncbi:PAS domain S-box protein [Shewanella sp. A25]|nr:PAS domain S-box protein [Shewanella shenzhenensis]
MTRLISYKRASKWGLLVFVFGLFLSLLLTWQVAQTNTHVIEQELSKSALVTADSIIKRIELYQYGLRGARGTILTAGEQTLNRDIFHAYSLTREVDDEFPGARGFGFIRRVSANDTTAYLKRVREQGWPEFQIRELSANAGDKYLIEYIEPYYRNKAAVGLDIASEANRKQAADNALRTGKVRLTGPITLVQATGKPLQSFLILMPIYRSVTVPATEAERLAEGFGWSYAPLVTNEVLADLDLSAKATKLILRDVSNADDPAQFYETHSDVNDKTTRYQVALTQSIYGRQWQFEVIALPEFVSALNLFRPGLVLFSGALFSLLVAALIVMGSLNWQRRQQFLAEQSRRASMLEHSLDGIISFDSAGKITSWNQGAEQLFGFSEDQVLGLTSDGLIIPSDVVNDEQALFTKVLSGKTVLNRISMHQCADGRQLATSTTAIPIFDANGEIVGLSQTIRDITAQQDAERNILNQNASLERKVTKRTQALQQALLENQALLDTINQQLHYSVTDFNGIILSVNDYFCEVSGFEREELLGHTHALLSSGEHDTAFWKSMWDQIKSGKPWHGEICNRAKNGSRIWFDTVIGPVLDEHGKIERFVALRTDITERKLIQLERNRINALLSNVLDAASEMSIIATDPEGLITVFNRGAERLLGYKADEMIGKMTPAPLHLESEVISRSAELSQEYDIDIEGFRTFVHKASVEGSETRVWTYIRKDGSHFQVSLSVTAMRDSDGEVTGYLGIGVDMTQMLLQQRALVTASNQLTKAAEVAKLGIWTMDLLDNSLHWNDRMFAIYDQPESLRDNGLNYEHWRMRIHPDDLSEAEAKFNAAIQGNDEYEPIFRVLTTNGSVRYVQAGAKIERDKFGRVTRITGINIDITAQRQLEATLRQAKHEAEAANEAKSAFLANMSHEIRTPMNAVLGMLQLIQYTSLSVQQQGYVSKAHTAAKSLLGLLNDILDFSKIDAGKLSLDLHPCAIELLLRDLAVVLSASHSNREVEVMFDIDSNVPSWLLADQLRLQQILINLAGNALKFTRHGQVVVSLKCLQHQQGSTRVQFAIEDTGIGISEEQLERIFTGFEQAESSTSRRFGGTGLGLAISKRLVELMGGQLQVSSTLGVGSKFWFELDLPVVEGVASQRVSLKGRRILVVDDNELTTEILNRILRDHDCDVMSVLGGYQAIEAVKQANEDNNPFDVVLMDWRMPDIDGLQTAERIRESNDVGMTPLVVMLTAYGNEVFAERQHLEQVPFVNFLTKPVTSQTLVETLVNAIEGVPMEVNPPPLPQRLLTGLSILVVEDNQLNRQVVDELLSYEGAKVVLAKGGLEGVSQVFEHGDSFDIVIMDVQMPDIDGLEATRRIRADSRFNDLPILAMTANASQTDKQECLNAGMNAHVGKPIDIQLLIPNILRLVGRDALAQDMEDTTAAPVEYSAADSDALLDELPLILKRFGGNQAFFEKMAKSFPSEIDKELVRFKQATRERDYANAAAISHAIKGLGSNFGARRLAEFAKYLEEQFKQEALELLDLKPWTEKLESLILQSCEALAGLFTEERPSHVNKPQVEPVAEVQDINMELQNLASLLQASNLEAMSVIETLAPMLERHPLWPQLYGQVGSLDFTQASVTLSTIMLEEA